MFYDLIVAGGGVAGVCCAIRAAREGLKTALFEARGELGGNAADCCGILPSGGVTFRPFMMETGLIGEMLLDWRASKETFSQVLLRWVQKEERLDLYRNALVVRCEVQNRQIRSVNGFSSKWFADCTGDSALARLAGARVRYGREGLQEFGESLAPDMPDDEVMGSTILFRAIRQATPVPYTAPADAHYYADLSALSAHNCPPAPKGDVYSGFYWLELSSPLHTVLDEAEIACELNRHLDGIWDMLKNRSPYADALANFALVWRSLPGKRESYRVQARKTLTENDIRYRRYAPDGVATAGWYIDLHKPGAFLHGEPVVRDFVDENYKNRAYTAPFNVPLDALRCQDISNLWMAGRNIGVTHVALGAVRVMNTLGNLGEAVAVACSGAKDVPRALALRDIRILGATAIAAEDQAQRAHASASSEAVLALVAPGKGSRGEMLETPWAQVFPVVSGHLEAIEAFVAGEGRVEWALTPAIDLWDNASHPPIAGGCVCARNGLARIEVNRSMPEGAYRLILRGETVAWKRALQQPIGVAAQYYHRATAVWNQNRGDAFAFAMRVYPAQHAYAPRFALNGKRHPEALPNLWRTEDEEAIFALDWAEPTAISRVELTVDTDLNCDWARVLPDRACKIVVKDDAGRAQWVENPPGRRITFLLGTGYTRRLTIQMTGKRIGIYNLSAFA